MKKDFLTKDEVVDSISSCLVVLTKIAYHAFIIYTCIRVLQHIGGL